MIATAAPPWRPEDTKSFTNNILDHAWIPITIAAAVMQALRTAVQKTLTLNLSPNAKRGNIEVKLVTRG
ncbi:MAG: hypothetical protein EXR10_01080 [Alphaproteobacteria bacterium]|nr:hypothetical protein [Alphaproteobacteria bacterium]PHY01479.1 MAG: hypothetical protein CK529_01085 [Rhodospirillaceae bacterium]